MIEDSALQMALGAAVGAILALTGAGGGILAVPLLMFGLHLPVARSAPVGLIAVGLASALGAALGLRDGIVRYRAAALIGVAGMLLAPLGVQLGKVVPNGPLTLAFACLLAYVGVRMLRAAGRSAQDQGAHPVAKAPCALDPATGRLVWTMPCGRALAATGLVSGFLSGLLGVGGGFVIVPSLTRFTNLETRSIVATSLAVIALVSVGGVSAAAAQGTVDWDIAAPFSAGAVLALLLGRRVAARLAGPHLQRAFAITSLAVSVLMVGKGLGWIAA
jgi:uncharacterized protein